MTQYDIDEKDHEIILDSLELLHHTMQLQEFVKSNKKIPLVPRISISPREYSVDAVDQLFQSFDNSGSGRFAVSFCRDDLRLLLEALRYSWLFVNKMAQNGVTVSTDGLNDIEKSSALLDEKLEKLETAYFCTRKDKKK